MFWGANPEVLYEDKHVMNELTEITNKRFDYITTLESQGDDELDFPEVSILGLRDILIQAYMLGYDDAY